MCHKFLTLQFGCVQEGLLGFQGKTFSPPFDWECLNMMAMETRKNNEGDVVVFMALMFLCRFLLFGMNEMQ
jgi:hypothetical protein